MLELNAAIFYGNIDDQAKCSHVGQNGGSPIAEEGEGDACDGHDAHGHCNIFKDLKGEHADDSHDYKSAKQVLTGSGHLCHGVDEPGIDGNDGSPAQKSQFFYNNGIDKVGITNGKEFNSFWVP